MSSFKVFKCFVVAAGSLESDVGHSEGDVMMTEKNDIVVIGTNSNSEHSSDFGNGMY